jgi:hypothetical protein
MGRMERTILCFAMLAMLLILVLVSVARVPTSSNASAATPSQVKPLPHLLR